MLLAYEELVKEKCEVPDMLIIGNIAEHLKKEITPLMERNAKIIHLPFQEEYVLKTLVKTVKDLYFPLFTKDLDYLSLKHTHKVFLSLVLM